LGISHETGNNLTMASTTITLHPRLISNLQLDHTILTLNHLATEVRISQTPLYILSQHIPTIHEQKQKQHTAKIEHMMTNMHDI